MRAALANTNLRREAADVVMQYRWLTPEDGKRMLGWLACALASDSLRHRPHVWFSGYPGKSWFMTHIQDALHQHRYHIHYSPTKAEACYRRCSESLPPQLIDGADFRDTNKRIMPRSRRKVQKVIQACRAASGRFDQCGNYGPLNFSACLMSWHQPDLTRYETRQFAPVRLGPESEMPYADFLRYQAEVKKLFGNETLALQLQESILESAEDIAQLAVNLDRMTQEDDHTCFHQIEITAIRGALSAGWQWWSETDELLGYWQGERPIRGDSE